MDRLFVYGTLAPGRPNEHLLKDVQGTWEQGWVTGTLHEEGWGARMGYPAIKLDPDGDTVSGFLFSSDHLKSHWEMLDEFEGDAYERVRTTVQLKDGSSKEAYVYTLAVGGTD